MKRNWLALALYGLCAPLAVAQVAVLHIQVIEGEGSVNTAGSHIARPLAVEVTDETGKPVVGASVSFHLPEEGPGGSFGNGLRTDVTITDARGRANLHTLMLNQTPGRFAIRIVASKEQARAGMVAYQYIAPTKNGTVQSASPAPGSKRSFLRGPLKWVMIAALAGGAAAGAMLAAKSGSGAGSPESTATGPTSPGITIGSPTLTVGKP